MKKYYKDEEIVASIDIGSSRVACLIAKIDRHRQITIISHATRASRGINNGIIVDLSAAQDSIAKTLHEAESKAAALIGGYPLRDIVMSFPSLYTSTVASEGTVETDGRRINSTDMLRCMADAQKSALEKLPSNECELVHIIPTEYGIDGNWGIVSPSGIDGRSLSVKVNLITAQASPLKTMVGALERAHLSVDALCVNPYAAGLACLVEDEMDIGATIIDLGAGTTSWAVFASGSMIHADGLAIGGDHITNDMAQGLNISKDDATRIKVLYGSAIAGSFDNSEKIAISPFGQEEGAELKHIQRSMLVGIIQPRVEEIFESVRARLHDCGHAESGRIVLTGGGSMLSGVKDLAQHVLDRPVRLGRPLRPSGLPNDVVDPSFAVSAGLLHYLTHRYHEMPANIMQSTQPVGIISKTCAWLKENW